MAFGSIMVAVNVSDSRGNSLPSPPVEKSNIKKSAPRKTCSEVTKNLTSASLLTNKQTAKQLFYDAASVIVPDSKLQNKKANLERQVLEAKKPGLQKQLRTFTLACTGTPEEEPAAISVRAKNSNF